MALIPDQVRETLVLANQVYEELNGRRSIISDLVSETIEPLIKIKGEKATPEEQERLIEFYRELEEIMTAPSYWNFEARVRPKRIRQWQEEHATPAVPEVTRSGLQVPDGFTQVDWKDTREGQTVYLVGVKDDKPHAYGPFTVFSKLERKLRATRPISRFQRSFRHYAEDLLVEV